MSRSTLRTRALRALATALIAALAGLGVQAADDPYEAPRALFSLAYAAAEADAPTLVDPPELQAYPLYPYLERARLLRGLARAAGAIGPTDRRTEAFLSAHAGEPVAGSLRAAWLESLAGRELWVEFAAAMGAVRSPSVALRCQALNGRIARGGDEHLRADVAAAWLTAERMPQDCERAFDWLRHSDGMTEELVEQRVLLLLGNGQTEFARLIARRLPAQRAAYHLAAADLLDRPASSIDALLVEPTAYAAIGRDLLLAAWRKLARSDSSAALKRYPGLKRAFDLQGAAASPYALALALGLAWDRKADDALRIFRDVETPDFDDVALGWRARAALWGGEWREARRSIAAMSPPARAEPRWRYWAARVAAELGDEHEANEIYRSIVPSDNFYAASAAARLGERALPHPAPLQADARTIADLTTQPPFVRARELKQVGLAGPALGEWQAATAALDKAEREQAIHVAALWEWHDVAVQTATRARVFFDYHLLYPRPFGAAVSDAAKFSTLETPLIYSLLRQESLFRSDAVSPAGAVGLAQLLPETARRVARNWRQQQPVGADLLEPLPNVRLGAAYLRELLDAFDGQTPVALAAYNAGPRAAARWLPESGQPADIWIENIPYNETRDYVQRILWHHVVFEWLESDRGVDFARWLGPIKAPRSQPSTPTGGANTG